ncbi:MAG: hypothetical protein DWH80_08670 [Planctomycetota bacterium]|nr:MAG: hypothetical protein DWH80_08670 [Planctomycetota bacterium]
MKLSSNLCNSQFVRITAEFFRLYPDSQLPKTNCPGIGQMMWEKKLMATWLTIICPLINGSMD